MIETPEAVLAFWRQAGPQKWFTKDAAFDEAIRVRFQDTHDAAFRLKLWDWQDTPDGALALVIVLDQFSRNIYRGKLFAFANDDQALRIARAAIDKGFDQQVPAETRSFFYLPFMHSENLGNQERCVELYRKLGDSEGLKYAEIHADIIRRFGRFPHRNAVLGRINTPEEKAFLAGGGFAG